MFDYQGNIQHWINRLSFMLRGEAQQRLRRAGFDLSAEEWALLMVLWRDGPTGMTRLADITLRDRTTVTRLVDRLIRKGLVLRQGAARDRRQVVIDLTKRGREIEAPVLRAIVPLIAITNRDIPAADLETTRRVLAQMAANLGATDEAASQ